MMKAMRIGRVALGVAILSAGMALGCSTTDECNGSGGGEPSSTAMSSSSSGEKTPGQWGYYPAEVHPMECPEATILLTGKIAGAPFTLMEPLTDFLGLRGSPGRLTVEFAGETPNDGFLFFTSEDIWDDVPMPVMGLLQLPNNTHRYQILRESRIVANYEFTLLNFHLVFGSNDDLEGCIGNYVYHPPY
jgi:hypothetical protein